MNLGIKHPPSNKRPLSIKHSLDYKNKQRSTQGYFEKIRYYKIMN